MDAQDVRNFLDLAIQVLRYNKRILTDENVEKISEYLRSQFTEEDLAAIMPMLRVQESLADGKTEKLIESLERLKHRPLVLRTIASFL